MTSPEEAMIRDYVKRKDSMISHYDELLKLSNSPSVSMFLQRMKDIELSHRESLLAKSEILDDTTDFAHMLALTPINEMEGLSKAFTNVIEKKERLLAEHTKNLDHIEQHTLGGMAHNLNRVDHNLHQNLKNTKDKIRI